jgi:apolipoprotein D and lipocalin family protein
MASHRRPAISPRLPSSSGAGFDASHMGVSVARLAAAFCIGGVLALTALGTARVARAQAPTTATATAELADGASPGRAPLQAVAPVDLKRYAGTWHEQARLPNRFQKKCIGAVSAHYTPRPDGTVEVRNACAVAGGTDEVVGTARVVPVDGRPDAGRLKVRFAPDWLSWLPLVWGDYWILRLDRDYEVALVGTPDRDFLWVLSRSPRLDESRLAAELDHARGLGFDVDRVVRTPD